MIDDMLERETDDAPLNESNPIEATRCSGCGSTKCPECDGRKDAVRAVMAELHQFAQWIRSGAISHEDARDNMARALENRIRDLEKGWNLPLSTELGIVACMRLNAKLQAKLDHWKKESGYETPEEMIEAVTVRFKNELPKGLGRSLWLLEQLDRKKAEDALTQARIDIINLLANIDEMHRADGLEDDDRAVVENVRKRWVSDSIATDPAETPPRVARNPSRTTRCEACGGAPHAWTPDGYGWCERHSGGHFPPAEMPLTPEFVTQLRTEMPQTRLICKLREQLQELSTSLNSVRADYRKAQKQVDILKQEAVESHKVFLASTAIQVSENTRLLKERDAARVDVDARLKQNLNQVDIDNRAIKEWERALDTAVNFLRSFIIEEATDFQRETACLFIKDFDSRRKAGTTLVKYPKKETGYLCGGVGCNSCEPQGRG